MRIFIILIAILINLVAASKASAAEQIARNLTSAKESELGRISQILAPSRASKARFWRKKISQTALKIKRMRALPGRLKATALCKTKRKF